MIIDRENIKCEVVGEFGMYVIEVVAKHNTNIAKGKYLIAESQGKDASDILIIVALTKLL